MKAQRIVKGSYAGKRASLFSLYFVVIWIVLFRKRWSRKSSMMKKLIACVCAVLLSNGRVVCADSDLGSSGGSISEWSTVERDVLAGKIPPPKKRLFVCGGASIAALKRIIDHFWDNRAVLAAVW